MILVTEAHTFLQLTLLFCPGADGVSNSQLAADCVGLLEGEPDLRCLGGVGPSERNTVEPESSRASSSISSMSPAADDMSWSSASEMDGITRLRSWINLQDKLYIVYHNSFKAFLIFNLLLSACCPPDSHTQTGRFRDGLAFSAHGRPRPGGVLLRGGASFRHLRIQTARFGRGNLDALQRVHSGVMLLDGGPAGAPAWAAALPWAPAWASEEGQQTRLGKGAFFLTIRSLPPLLLLPVILQYHLLGRGAPLSPHPSLWTGSDGTSTPLG